VNSFVCEIKSCGGMDRCANLYSVCEEMISDGEFDIVFFNCQSSRSSCVIVQ
jgi:hypothetical protein